MTDHIEAPRADEPEAPRADAPEAPRTQDVQAPRVDEQAPVVEEAPVEKAPYVPEPHSYRVGDRVGLLARVTDAHDKGNISLEIEGTGGEQFTPPQYVHISESALHGGADMIYVTRQRRLAEAEGHGG